LVKKTQAEAVRNKIGLCKELFNFYSSNTRQNKYVLPDHQNDKILAHDFGTYFINKVTNITSTFDTNQPMYTVSNDDNGQDGLFEFHTFQPDQILKLRSMKISTVTDRITAEIFKCLWMNILDYFTSVVNKSLEVGTFPSAFKNATLTPILKSPTLDKNLLSSYRPVSNTPFLAKVLETAVASQLNVHLDDYLSPYQSAFRSSHSVESALTHVSSSIFNYMDQGNDVFLILLDLSAAFDTIDHTLLLNILHERFKIRGTVLKWIKSYLQDRHFTVKVNGTFSEPFPLNVGVPQGSILGPVLFNCVMAELAATLSSLEVNFHIYADDTQIWFPFKYPAGEDNARLHVSEVFAKIETFMHTHHLKLNAGKTVFLPISRKAKAFESLELKPGCKIFPSQSARNLGILFDNQMSFDPYISELRKSCFHHLRNIKTLKNYIPSTMLPQLILAVIISRLDFCNSLLCALGTIQLKKLQLVQNACARMLTNTKRFESITPKLISLHWLPIKYRNEFKLACWGHKIAYSISTPKYLTDAVKIHHPKRFTRSSQSILLMKPDFSLKTAGGRSVINNIPAIWNVLPQEIRNISSFSNFKKELKTHLFKIAYNL
jgi:hypothetical protein